MIVRDGKRAVRLVAVRQAKIKIGLLQGKLVVGPDFFQSLEVRELERPE